MGRRDVVRDGSRTRAAPMGLNGATEDFRDTAWGIIENLVGIFGPSSFGAGELSDSVTARMGRLDEELDLFKVALRIGASPPRGVGGITALGGDKIAELGARSVVGEMKL